MAEDFRTGRPPTWRVVIYALIAMVIPVYFSYPRLGELSVPLRILFWFVVVAVGGGMVVYFATIPWIVANLKMGPPKRRRLIYRVIIAAILFGMVCQVIASICDWRQFAHRPQKQVQAPNPAK